MLYGYLPAILEGLGLTLRVSALSLAIACVFGLIGAAAKLSGSRTARWSAEVYTTLIRGMPELVLMLLIFYGGQIGINRLAEAQGWDYIDVPPFLAGVLTIGFIFGAYLTETFRGAILAVPRGQAMKSRRNRSADGSSVPIVANCTSSVRPPPMRGSLSNTEGRPSGSSRDTISPSGLWYSTTRGIRGAKRSGISLPLTRTRSPGPTFWPTSAGSPLTEMRPATIHSSISRRDPTPAAASTLCRRCGSV